MNSYQYCSPYISARPVPPAADAGNGCGTQSPGCRRTTGRMVWIVSGWRQNSFSPPCDEALRVWKQVNYIISLADYRSRFLRTAYDFCVLRTISAYVISAYCVRFLRTYFEFIVFRLKCADFFPTSHENPSTLEVSVENVSSVCQCFLLNHALKVKTRLPVSRSFTE
jgi:hypothetical protein